ncbi:MAG: amidohydrolase [Thermoplasmata archaeon]
MKISFVNGRIYKHFNPPETCDAITVENGRVIYAGESARARLLGHRIIDLHGKTVIPGIIDAHMHLDELGTYLNILDLRGTRSIREMRERLRDFAATHEGPIMGHGWDQEMFEEKRWPVKEDIDDIVNDRPVLLSRVCLHAALVNSFFINAAGYRSTSGIVKEEEFEAFRTKFNSLVPSELKRKFISDALKELARNGITSVGFVSCSKESFNILKDMDKNGEIAIRVNVYMNAEDLESALKQSNTDHLRVKGVKLFVDGSLGARTALLSRDYDDEATRGEQVFSWDFLRGKIDLAVRNGLQVAMHAIGDGAMDIAISLLRDHPRQRIEHCSVVRDDQLVKLKGFNAVVQPHFLITDFWIKERLGEERARWAYRFRDLSKVANVAFSTDSPVEPIDPFQTIYAAVTRGFNEGIFLSKFEDQKFSVTEALRYYTEGAAIALGEKYCGRIDEGYFADFAILPRDPLSIDPKELLSVKPDSVYVSGVRIF